jgi:hypothetical protein
MRVKKRTVFLREDESSNPLASATNRRETLRRCGVGVLAALAAGGTGGRILAQEATPRATPSADGPEGGYAVIRLRSLKPDRLPEDLTSLVRTGFLPLLRQIPGFVSYDIVWNEVTRDWTAIGIFADRAGAEESNRRAAEWGPRSGASDLVEGEPVVIEGAILLAARADG